MRPTAPILFLFAFCNDLWQSQYIHAFRRGRECANWLGLTPCEHSSGGRRWLGHISKRGDRYLRLLLTHGGRAVVLATARCQRAGRPMPRLYEWALEVRTRFHVNKAIVAVANKLARLGLGRLDMRCGVRRRVTPTATAAEGSNE